MLWEPHPAVGGGPNIVQWPDDDEGRQRVPDMLYTLETQSPLCAWRELQNVHVNPMSVEICLPYCPQKELFVKFLCLYLSMSV